MDYNVVKAMINKGESNSLVTVEPEIIYPDLTIRMHQVVSSLAGKLSRSDWKREQLNDVEIGPVLRLVRAKKHLQYKFTKNDSSAFRTIMRFRMDLRIVDDLLYRKWPLQGRNCLFAICVTIYVSKENGVGLSQFFWPPWHGQNISLVTGAVFLA